MSSFLVIVFFKVKNKKTTLMLIAFYFIHESKILISTYNQYKIIYEIFYFFI